MAATMILHAMVPPCVVDTDVRDQLARRMIIEDWHFHRWCDLGDFPTPDTPPEGLKKIQRKLWKQANPPVYSCVVCATPTKRSCQVCREVYYCGHECQKKHWKQHKGSCKSPVPLCEVHHSIAVPDYECFWRYQAALPMTTEHVGLMIMTRNNFENMFGVEATQNTVNDLAILGQPAVYMAKAYNIPQQNDYVVLSGIAGGRRSLRLAMGLSSSQPLQLLRS